MVKKNEKEKEINLTGTLISVFGLGIFILIAWFSMYFFHLSR
ncbi:cytochrome c oxidase subunit 2A [Virgibacillus sp. DJP39]